MSNVFPQWTLHVAHAEEIRAHIERNLGKIVELFPDPAPGQLTIDVCRVDSSATRPFQTLVTIGMSDRPMWVPASEPRAPRYLELMMTLPEDWKFDAVSRSQVNCRWPLDELWRLAHLPHARESWLGWGHTVPNGSPPQPYAPNTQLCGVILAPSLLVNQDFYQLDAGTECIAFFSAIPLYAEELAFHNEQGMGPLLSRLLDRDIKDVIHANRKNVAKKRFGFF